MVPDHHTGEGRSDHQDHPEDRPTTGSDHGFTLPPLAAGETRDPIVAKFTATDDGKIDFAALVTAAGPVSTLRGLGASRLSIKPKYLLKFASKVIHPGRSAAAGGAVDRGAGHRHEPVRHRDAARRPALPDVRRQRRADGTCLRRQDAESLRPDCTAPTDPGPGPGTVLRVVDHHRVQRLADLSRTDRREGREDRRHPGDTDLHP